jgi:carboxyl-terminal processing protease
MKRPNLLNKTPLPYLLTGVFAVVFIAAVACGNSETAPASTPVVDQSAGEVTTASDEGFPEVIPLDVPLQAPAEVAEELRIIWEAWAILTRDHVDRANLDPSIMSEAAIRGMLFALGDPHTNYVSPATFAVDSNDIFQGEFEGIGAHVSSNRNGVIVIVAPIAGGPAETAGIRPGDQILGVNGESIEGLSVLEAVALIRGPKGSTVSLEVKHLGALDPVIIEIVRGVIPLTSVLVRSQPDDKFLHVRLTNFYPETAQELDDAITKAVANGAQGLVLDVRDNPGGLLSSVVDIAELFLEEGLVLYQVDGSGKRSNWNVSSPGDFTDLPMVILANGFSASASEVLAGAMQDHRRALLIGESTFGKGSVNILRPLSNGGGMFITTSRWYTPLGRLIQDVGLDPDIEVTATDARDQDVQQLERALEELERLVAATPASAGI